MIRRFRAFPQFFDGAEEMRALFEQHFAEPHAQTELSHGVWNYWCVPGMYTYLRAAPERLFGALQARFMERLRTWSIAELGLDCVTSASLHLYIDGCGQGLHSDFHNGVFGYVFSLTRWGERTFAGGETLLFKDGTPNYKRHHASGDLLYDLVAPELNQLLVFDDRIAHAVAPLSGTMSPTARR